MTTPNTSPVPEPRSSEELLPPVALEQPLVPPVEPIKEPTNEPAPLGARAEWEGRGHLRPQVQSVVDGIKQLFARNPDRVGLGFRFIGFSTGQGKMPIDALDNHLKKHDQPQTQPQPLKRPPPKMANKRHSKYWY